MSVGCRLDGRGVLVTRPASQAQGLCRLIEAAGGVPVLFPTVEILPPQDPEAARRRLAEPWDIVIFISRNAVEHGLALCEDRRVLAAAQRAAVGRATAEAMRQAELAPGLVPDAGFDSEALLALPPLNAVGGRRVLIVRGEGGRALLGETLARRGAEVAYAEVYRRAAPTLDAAELLPQWQRDLALVTATSDEVLTNLLGMVPASAHRWLQGLPLAVLSERNVVSARALGFRAVAAAGEPSDAGLCDALCRLLAGSAGPD
jgi:uroporphyrinogen-III synthase